MLEFWSTEPDLVTWMPIKVRNSFPFVENCILTTYVSGFDSWAQNTLLPIPYWPKIKLNISVPDKVKAWSQKVDVSMFFYLLMLTIFAILSVYWTFLGRQELWWEKIHNQTLDNSTKEEDKEEITIPKAWIVFRWGQPGQALQFTACYLQLIIIMGLCLDGGKSWTARLFCTKVMQFLGRISMALYLVHLPLAFWLNVIIFGPEPVWENGQKPEGQKMPLWAIPIHVIISLIFGVLLTILVEEPARKFLNKWIRKDK